MCELLSNAKMDFRLTDIAFNSRPICKAYRMTQLSDDPQFNANYIFPQAPFSYLGPTSFHFQFQPSLHSAKQM